MIKPLLDAIVSIRLLVLFKSHSLCFLPSQWSTWELNVQIISVHWRWPICEYNSSTFGAVWCQCPEIVTYPRTAWRVIEGYGSDPVFCDRIDRDFHWDTFMLFVTNFRHNILYRLCNHVDLIWKMKVLDRKLRSASVISQSKSHWESSQE